MQTQQAAFKENHKAAGEAVECQRGTGANIALARTPTEWLREAQVCTAVGERYTRVYKP